MASVGVPDAKELEGRKDGENRPSVQSRDFFWDSVTLFVVGAILSLSAIDFITEYVRGSKVQCFFNRSAVADSFENVGEYVNERCAASLPPAEYLPAFIAVHAILILAPHYIWLNLFGAKLDSFFHLVSGLIRTREPSTGDYPESNYVISKQLDAFSSGTHRSNSMHRLYLLKLFVQLLLSLGGFVAVLFFGDFNETFTCPEDREESLGDDWPLTGKTVMCVFTSLRLLHKIWIIYLVLLLTTILCLGVGFIWLVDSHAKDLSLDKVAEFSFQTSLPFHHFTPPITFVMKLGGLSPTAYSILSIFLAPSFKRINSYHIQTDYDFLLVKLFRTDGGLAQVLREVHLLRLLKEQNNVELARISSHKTVIEFDDENKKAMVDRKFLNADLGWRNFDLVDKHDTVDHHTPLLLPPTIRGVVLGLSARCVGSVIDPPPPDLPNKLLCGALCIVFDSESIGFAGALARVFERVAVINFSKAYSNYHSPVSVSVNNSSLVVGMTTPHDIIMTDRVIETQVDTGEETKLIIRKRAVTRFYDDFIDEIWKPGYIYSRRLDDIKAAGGGKTIRVNDLSHLSLAQYLTDYIVIGPISTDIQRAAVNMFLDTKKGFISEDAVLVTIQPLEISGVKVDSDLFPQFIPFGFKPLPHIAPDPTRVEALQQSHPHLSIYSWPQKATSSCTTETAGINRGVQPGALNEWVVTTGDTRCKFRFSLFTCESSRLLRSQASGTKRDQSATTGGQTAAKQDQAATTVTPHGKGEGKSLSDTGSD